ncbi:MAG: hypothetical protein ABL916_23800 [Burkholderiaceae bacterium]
MSYRDPARIELGQQGAHERGLARADLAADNDKTRAFGKPAPELDESAVVPLAVEIEARVGRELERRAGDTEVRFVHS